MRFPRLPRRLAVALVAALLTAAPFHPLHAQEQQGVQGTDPATVERLVQRIEDPARRQELVAELRALLETEAAAEPEPPPSASSGIGGRLIDATAEQVDEISRQIAGAGRAFLAAPDLVRDLAAQATDADTRTRWLEMAGKVVLVLVVGLLAEWIARRVLGRARTAIEERGGGGLGLRALFLLLRTILDAVPIVAFAAAAYGLLPLLEPRYVTRLVALTLINANVLIRLTLLVSRLILVPRQPALRLLPMSDETVAYLYVWLRRVLRLSIYGYFVLEAALLLGLPGPAHQFLLKLLGLTVAGMVIVMIMQNRKSVSEAIAGHGPGEGEGPAGEEGVAATVRQRLRVPAPVRQRLGQIWHIIALGLVVALYGVWALEIPGGFQFLSQAIGLTLVALAVAAVLSRALQHGTERLFRISEDLREAYPGLEARANRYLPFLRGTLKAIVWVFAASAVLQAWGLGTLQWLFSDSGTQLLGNLISIFLIIAFTFLIWEVVSGLIERTLARRSGEPGASTRLLTLLPLLRNVVRIGLGLISAMIIFSELGVNIGPLLAGAGVIGLAVGFGAQTLVRDVITGAFILIEDAISVGDVVTAGGYTGTVESISIRTVRMRDLHGTLHMVPFGEVTSVLNYSREFAYALIDAGVAYREDYGEVVQVLQEVAAEQRADETVGPDILGDLEVFGLNNLADSAVEIRVRVMTRPGKQWGVRRDFLRRMKAAFDARDIEIPFPHQTLWFGVDKDGSAPPARVLTSASPVTRSGQGGGEPPPETEPTSDQPVDHGEPTGGGRGET